MGACGVDRFVSNYSNRLDAKGRVSIPAPFRAILARDGHEGLFLYPSLDTAAVDCGGNALKQAIDDVLSRYSPYSEQWETLSVALYGASEVLKIDAEGRVVLSEMVRVTAGITTEVTFVGQGHKFQIWEPSRFRARFEEAKLRLREVRQELGSGYAAPTPRPPGARE